jgi:hypothetical protein
MKKHTKTKRVSIKRGGFQVSKKTTKQNEDNNKITTTNSTTTSQNISKSIPRSNIKNKTRRQRTNIL